MPGSPQLLELYAWRGRNINSSDQQMRRSHRMGCCQIVHGLRASGISDHSYLKRTLNRIEKPPSKETANPRAEARHQPSKGACASKVAGGTFMRHLQSVLAMLVATVLIGCGAGHANLTSITVSPQSAT